MAGVFITGTDTGIGKTKITAGLARAFARRGIAVAALKPVASGASNSPDGLQNADAMMLRAAANVALEYSEVNPYVFPEPIAPHLAAGSAGRRIELTRIASIHEQVCSRASWVLVEGVGGWRVPINESADVSGLARQYAYPVLLVVGLRLGCINHASLTAEAIARDGLAFAGWIANALECDYDTIEGTIAAISASLGQRPQARVDFCETDFDQGFMETMDTLCTKLLARYESG